mmetsp:Transcript_7101/g.20815  ORF Transcript_7101/g.20815 Transcript_7101/m.20815 type:complete len:308 (-) Transcript_7101:1127-2050(-)
MSSGRMLGAARTFRGKGRRNSRGRTMWISMGSRCRHGACACGRASTSGAAITASSLGGSWVTGERSPKRQLLPASAMHPQDGMPPLLKTRTSLLLLLLAWKMLPQKRWRGLRQKKTTVTVASSGLTLIQLTPPNLPPPPLPLRTRLLTNFQLMPPRLAPVKRLLQPTSAAPKVPRAQRKALLAKTPPAKSQPPEGRRGGGGLQSVMAVAMSSALSLTVEPPAQQLLRRQQQREYWGRRLNKRRGRLGRGENHWLTDHRWRRGVLQLAMVPAEEELHGGNSSSSSSSRAPRSTACRARLQCEIRTTGA